MVARNTRIEKVFVIDKDSNGKTIGFHSEDREIPLQGATHNSLSDQLYQEPLGSID